MVEITHLRYREGRTRRDGGDARLQCLGYSQLQVEAGARALTGLEIGSGFGVDVRAVRGRGCLVMVCERVSWALECAACVECSVERARDEGVEVLIKGNLRAGRGGAVG